MSDQKLIDGMLTLQTSIEELNSTLNSIFANGETLRDLKFVVDDFSKAVKEFKEAKTP